MAIIDVIRLTAPLTEDDPCGPDLEYQGVDVLERLAMPEPERVEAGTVIPAKEPDWTAVKKAALDLSERTRDLRVAVRLAIALLRTDAWQGFSEGLQLIEALLKKYWDGVHPRLDPDDGFDSIARTSILGVLGQTSMTLRIVRVLPLARSPKLGRIRYRDVLIARDEVKPTGEDEAFDLARVKATFHDADFAELASTREQISAALDSTLGIAEQLSSHDADNAVEQLADLLQAIARLFGDQFQTRPMDPMDVPDAPSTATGAAQVATSRGSASIASPTDVAATLDRLIDYYRRHEPSSPLPLLLERARNLVGKDFLTIVNDLIPAGRGELDVLRGHSDAESGQE